MLFSLMFVIMTWVEVFATIDDTEVYIEYDSANELERISYSRLVPTAMVLISFSQAPITMAYAIINGYAKMISSDNVIIMDIKLYFAWISLSLFLFSIWKIVIIFTSHNKAESKLHGYKQLTKLVGTGIVTLIALIYYVALGDNWRALPIINLIYPIFSIFAYFFFIWLIVIPWQMQQEVPFRSGYIASLLIILLASSPYLLLYGICTC